MLEFPFSQQIRAWHIRRWRLLIRWKRVARFSRRVQQAGCPYLLRALFFPAAGNNHKYAICRRFVLLERLLAHQQSGPTHCRGTSFRPIAQTLHGSCLTMVFNSLWDNRSMGLEQVGSFNRLTCMAERTVLIHN